MTSSRIEYQRAYRLKNKLKIAAYQLEYKKKHAEHLKKYYKDYRDNNDKTEYYRNYYIRTKDTKPKQILNTEQCQKRKLYNKIAYEKRIAKQIKYNNENIVILNLNNLVK